MPRAFDHVLVIMFENQYRSYVLGNSYMRQLSKQGIELRNYFGVMHPSQTNYIASVAGELCNVSSDDRPELLDVRTVVDLIEEAPGRLRWKGYMDSYVPESTPWTPDFSPEDAHPYYVKHNPFSTFTGIVRNEARWRKVESEAALFSDLLNGELPEYAWFSPNVWNDGHWINGTLEDCKPRAPGLVDQLAVWLEGFFARLRFPGPTSHLPPRTLVVLTFDEADFEQEHTAGLACVYDGPNQVYAVLLGDGVEPGVEHEGYNHYSLLRTIELNFGLDHLGKNDAGANWFQFLWGRRFGWNPPQATPLGTDGRGGLCAGGYEGALFAGYAVEDGTMRMCTRSPDPTGGLDGRWSVVESLPIDGSGGAALAATATEMVLVARSGAGAVQYLTYDLQHGWSKKPEPLGDGETFALASFDAESRLMLAIADSKGMVTSRIWSDDKWAKPVEVGAARTSSGGALALASLGTSLFLVSQASDGDHLDAVTYNCATFNVITAPTSKYSGAQDNTSIEAWSPSAFPVAHFSNRPDAVGERHPDSLAYESNGPLALAALDGVMHLVHPGPGNPLLLTETFSIAGVLTPAKPVSYKSADSATASNGFGTLAAAGWSRQAPIFDARCEPGGELAMARAGDEVLLLVRARPGVPAELRIGRYEVDG
jgi:hypothetical protein